MRTSHPRTRPSRLAWLLAAALALPAACRSSAVLPPGADNPGLSTGELRQVNPLDIAVLPIENQTGRDGLPLESMRRHFHAGLVDRHYSPLALDFVDRQVTEASYQPGASDEDADLRVVITGWDDRLWRTHTRLVIDADVWLVDPARPSTADALWGGHVTRTMEMARQRDATAGDPALLEYTVRDFVEAVLASLPSRDPKRAPTP